MFENRVIPCLLLRERGFYKTLRFKNPRYLGDPLNILRIFNEKEVDEIFVLDISGAPPDIAFLKEMASECFMPLGYGGGVRTLGQIASLFEVGFEKVSVNTLAIDNPGLIEKAASCFGSQSIVLSMDVKRNLLGSPGVVTYCGKKRTGKNPVEFACEMERLGVGEILLNSLDRDGTMQGYDLLLLSSVAEAVNIPVVACGGAGKIEDLGLAIKAGASAVAAGSMFVFQGPRHAVLINLPCRSDLERVFHNL